MSEGTVSSAGHHSARAGVRLAEFQLLNWGTFDGAVYSLNLDGGNALLTGQVGAGKSTLVDALTILFAPTNRVTFNQAAGASRTERTAQSYVLGHYRNVYDEATGGTKPAALRSARRAYSVLIARFTGVRTASMGVATAGAAFWFTDGATTLNRLYFVAPLPLAISEHLVGHKDPRAVRAALRSAGAEVFDNFKAYQKCLCRQLGITPAGLDLLVQTISMKQVGNLTEFVRAHMLDATESGSRINDILNHYQDLTRAHELVVSAREQLAMLDPVRDAAGAYDRAEGRINASQLAQAAVPNLAERHRLDLVEAAILEVERQLPSLEAQLQAVVSAQSVQEERRTQLAVAVQRGGGADLQEAQHLLDSAEDRLASMQRAVDEMSSLAATAGIAPPTSTADFPRFHASVEAQRRDLAESERELRDRDFQLQQQLSDASRELRTLQEELAAAGDRDSNVPLADARMRAEIAEGVGVAVDALPFAAELISVAEYASDWEAAAERLVAPFALSMLVTEELYPKVAAWVDVHDLRRKLRYYRVPQTVSSSAAKPGTIAACLDVKPGTGASAWLRGEVNRRFDFDCVANTTDLAQRPRAITRAGQIRDGARHEKDDTRRAGDRRFYVLGWDTSARRVALQEAIPVVAGHVTELEQAQEVLSSEREEVREREFAARQLTERYADPKAVDLATALEEHQTAKDLYDTLAKQPELAELLDQQGKCEAAIQRLQTERSRLDGEHSIANRELNRLVDLRDSTEEALAKLDAPELDADAVEALDTALLGVGSAPASVEDCGEWKHRVITALRQRADSATETKAARGRDLTAAMGAFAARWPELVSDIVTTDPASRVEYLGLRERLEKDDLPRFEHEFKQLLETNAVHELVAFSNFLDREAEKIKDRIATINSALSTIEYRSGTYIRLEVEPTDLQIVREFRGQLRDVTSDALQGDDDEHTEARFLRVKDLLDRFRGRDGTAAADATWTARVTDVRNWFGFAASERTREEDSPVEHYTDSGGKSGGQKEKLAYTILAASLSYQYGLASGNDNAFRFVMIDEAFGRGSDESTRFGLELFDRLGLQLLVVTPLQKITTIEPFVSSVGYVRSDETRSTMLTMTIAAWREQAAIARAAARANVYDAAADLASVGLPRVDGHQAKLEPPLSARP